MFFVNNIFRYNFISNKTKLFLISIILNFFSSMCYGTHNLQNEEMKFHSLTTSNDAPQFSLLGCTRKIHTVEDTKPQYKNFFRHCYVKLVREDGLILGTRGYFADSGSIAEPEQTRITETCEILRVYQDFGAAYTDWQKVVGIYNMHHLAEYKLTSHNCCTVASEATQEVSRTDFFKKVNSGVGTTLKL